MRSRHNNSSELSVKICVLYSYNLRYLGKIIQISANTVTIEEPYNMYGQPHGRRHRLDMNEFCWRNSGFDLAEANRQNFEESHYI